MNISLLNVCIGVQNHCSKIIMYRLQLYKGIIFEFHLNLYPGKKHAFRITVTNTVYIYVTVQ